MSNEFWSEIINEGVEDRVEVNQRMLIDKMLSRYSSDFVVLRELIQNSDDAESTLFILEIFCDLNKTSDLIDEDNTNNSNLFGNIGKLFKNHLISNSENENQIENQFNNCFIHEIRTINNGKIFNEDDWKRVITIAEGNTNVDAIGQFGVGFFSVFSYSEKPIIQSGKSCLAFSWQNGKSLTTFRKELSQDKQTSTTSIILPMKTKFVLQTKLNKKKLKSKTNRLTNEIIPLLNLNDLKSYFIKVLSFTKYLNKLIIKINNEIIFEINKTIELITKNKLSANIQRLNASDDFQFIHFDSLKQTEQTFTILNQSSITLNHIDVIANIHLDKQFQKQMENVLKKSLPNQIHIQFLFPSNQIFQEENFKNSMLKTLIPLRFHEKDILPDGKIFIGLATNQSTGIGMHLFTHLIPTIERENIDLQDPFISIWNEQLLISIGKIIRFIYDQTIKDFVNQLEIQTIDQIHFILSPYAFIQSSPNKEIGRIIVDGFFSSDSDILVPVKRSPIDKHLSLIPSNEAYLITNKEMEKFLPLPIIPYEIGKHDFFQILKRRQWINEITNEILCKIISETIFSFNEFIELFHWLLTLNHHQDKRFLKEIFSKLKFRQINSSEIILLENIQYFDQLNLEFIPLPRNILPSSIISYISREDLQKRLFLSEIPIKYLIEYYLNEKQKHLFEKSNYSMIILYLISKHLNKFQSNEINEIKLKLSNIKCILTSQGMKLPSESYIPSDNLSSNLPIIQYHILQISNSNSKEEFLNYPISLELLKLIGCRTIYIQTNLSNDDNLQTNQCFIENLLKQRKTLSENDLKALKTSHCLIGITNEIKGKYLPHELYFPSISNRLQWKSLIILDWFDIEKNSSEYLFLKELGVKEMIELPKLISRINQEHSETKQILNEYQIPLALKFFAENFQSFYSKIWKNSNIKIPFLPSISPFIQQSTQVFLSIPEHVFKESSPLCSSLIPEVIGYFSQYFDIGLLGVKHRPSISIAFQILMEKRNELLNNSTASIYFTYLNKLDGLNKQFINEISKRSFIPLENNYMKINQVFIRPKSSQDKKFDEISTQGLIDYIDYGEESNSFLTSIGVTYYPSAENLANLLIDRQVKFLSLNNSNEILPLKLQFYTNCLKQLAVVSNVAREFHEEPLKSRLRNSSWCLGYQIIENSHGNKERIFRIVKPNEIYLDDDHQCSIDLHPLCAPDEPELTKLYEQFGAKWISESVHRTLIHQGKTFLTDRSQKLKDLILYRLDMLFVNNRGERIENLDEKRIELLRNKLLVYESEGIQCHLTFEKKTITLNSSECSSCALEFDKNQVYLFILKNLSTLDYIDIASELTRFVSKKAIHSLIHSISDKLSSPLETLKRRGIPVDRLLKIQQQTLQLSSPIEHKKLEEKPLQQEQSTVRKQIEDKPMEQQSSVRRQSQQIEEKPVQQQSPVRKQSQQELQNQSRGFLQSLKE
ncbi:hypothetical protein I4U23_017262 [Adineta vaga]|nr:hypothetical protein I4U23_017262 [Adineta vaga]